MKQLEQRSAREDMQPGAVWLAKRKGSRAGNRIVQRLGDGPRGDAYRGPKEGVYYLIGGRITWCTFDAWDSWAEKEQGEFFCISPEHIRMTEDAPAPSM